MNFKTMLSASLISLIMLGLVLSGCTKPASAPAQAPAPGKVYTLRFSDELVEGDYRSVGTKNWCNYIQEHSRGLIKVEYYTGGALYSASKGIEATVLGACEGILCPGSYLESMTPEWRALDAPGYIDSYDVLWKVLDSEVGTKLLTCLERAKLKGIAIPGHGGIYAVESGLGSKKPIDWPADMKGMKLRISTKEVAEVVSKYGGTPVTLSGGELFMALQQGVIDGSQISYSHFPERKLDEAGIKYMNLLPMKGYVSWIVAVNLDFFNSLPSDIQSMMLEAGKKLIDTERRSTNIEKAGENREYANKHGVISNVLTPEERAAWDVAFAPVNENLKKDAKTKELMDIMATVKKQAPKPKN